MTRYGKTLLTKNDLLLDTQFVTYICNPNTTMVDAAFNKTEEAMGTFKMALNDCQSNDMDCIVRCLGQALACEYPIQPVLTPSVTLLRVFTALGVLLIAVDNAEPVLPAIRHSCISEVEYLVFQKNQEVFQKN